MGKKGKGGPQLKAKKEKDIPLYRVYISDTNMPAYLPSGKGVPLEEAERLSKTLAAETFIQQVHFPAEEEE